MAEAKQDSRRVNNNAYDTTTTTAFLGSGDVSGLLRPTASRCCWPLATKFLRMRSVRHGRPSRHVPYSILVGLFLGISALLHNNRRRRAGAAAATARTSNNKPKKRVHKRDIIRRIGSESLFSLVDLIASQTSKRSKKYFNDSPKD